MSPLEAAFAVHMKALKLDTGMVREVKVIPSRRWRFDFAWPDKAIAVELEGGVYSGGRHTRGKGFEEDCIKYNTATATGWRVFRFTRRMVEGGEAAKLMHTVLGVSHETRI